MTSFRLALLLGAIVACGKGHKQDSLEAEFHKRFPGDACKRLKVEVGDWEKLRETDIGKAATSSYLSNPGSDRIAIIHGPYDGPVCDREGLCRGQEQVEIAAFYSDSTLHGAIRQVRGREVASDETLQAGCSNPGPPPDTASDGRKKLEKLVGAGVTPWSLATQRSVGIGLGTPADLIKAPPSDCPELRALTIGSSDDEFERKRKQDGQAAAAKACQAKLASAANIRGRYRIPIDLAVDEYNFDRGELMLRSLDSSSGYTLRRPNGVYVNAVSGSDRSNLRELELMFPPAQVPLAVPEAEAKALKQRLSGMKLSLDLVFELRGTISTGLEAGAIEANVLGYRVIDEYGNAIIGWISAPAMNDRK